MSGSWNALYSTGMPSDHPEIVHGDASAALQQLVDRYGGELFSLAQRFCGTREEAEDLVQEVFLSAFRSWEDFRGDSDVKTWLYRIAARACQRMHRKRAGEPSHMASLDAEMPFGDRFIGLIPSEQDDALQRQIHDEARARLEVAITRLPEEFRVPLILKEIAGFGVREVAEILGLEEGTVRSRVHRARLKLREIVDSAIPRDPEPAPPAAYDRQTCLDLLHAKQEALDRGVPFRDDIICERCRSVFEGLDLTHQLCRELAGQEIPPDLRERLKAPLGGGPPAPDRFGP